MLPEKWKRSGDTWANCDVAACTHVHTHDKQHVLAAHVISCRPARNILNVECIGHSPLFFLQTIARPSTIDWDVFPKIHVIWTHTVADECFVLSILRSRSANSLSYRAFFKHFCQPTCLVIYSEDSSLIHIEKYVPRTRHYPEKLKRSVRLEKTMRSSWTFDPCVMTKRSEHHDNSIRREKAIRSCWEIDPSVVRKRSDQHERGGKNRRTRNWLTAIEKSSKHRWITACSKVWTIHRNGYVSAGQALISHGLLVRPSSLHFYVWSMITFNFCIVYAPTDTIQGTEQSVAKAKTLISQAGKGVFGTWLFNAPDATCCFGIWNPTLKKSKGQDVEKRWLHVHKRQNGCGENKSWGRKAKGLQVRPGGGRNWRRRSHIRKAALVTDFRRIASVRLLYKICTEHCRTATSQKNNMVSMLDDVWKNICSPQTCSPRGP